MEVHLLVQGRNHEIPLIMDYPDCDGPFPCVLMLHGFLSQNGGKGSLFQRSTNAFLKEGIACARIDFCSQGENKYPRKEYGVKVCMEECEDVFHYLCRDERIIPERIGILGHSMGGRVAFLTADLPSKCLISYNGGIDSDVEAKVKLNGLDEKECAEKGYCLIGNKEIVYQRCVEELKIHNDKIFAYRNPILLCIGLQDRVVDRSIPDHFLKKATSCKVDVLEVEGANHTFNARIEGDTTLEGMLMDVVAWLKKNL